MAIAGIPRRKCFITVLLPAYNEAENITELLGRIHGALEKSGYDYEIVVVDDGSTDATAELARAVPFADRVRVIPHGVNKGLHEAMRTALTYLRDHPRTDVVGVTMDADNTHGPESIPEMVRIIEENRADVVIASRFVRGGAEHGLSAGRKLLSRGARVVMNLLFPMKNVSDFTCGYRAYRKSLVERAFRRFGGRFIEARSFSVMTEVLLKLRRLGVRVREVPLVLEYGRKRGRSKLRLASTLFDYLRVILRNLFA